MTVQNTIVKNVYVGNGSTTVFPFTFECNKAEHIQAFVKDAAGNITSTTNFKVDLEQKNLTYPNTGEPLANGDKLIILRQLPLQQLLNLLNQGPFYAEDIEETFDEVVMMLQQMTEHIGRSLAVSVDIDSENSFNTIIPLEAGKTFRVKDDGTGFEVTEDPGKVIDGAKALLKLTTEQAELAKEQADASSQSAVSAQNAAKEVKEIYGDGNFTPLSDLLGGLGTKLKRWGAIFANKVFASNLPIVYNSVAEMKAETLLWEGMNTKTLGYYVPNDGGGASYLIRAKDDTDVADGGVLHELANGLVAELIIDNGSVFPEQFGAKGDGVADDTKYLQIAINSGKVVVLTKQYLVSETIHISNPFSCIQGIAHTEVLPRIIYSGNNILINASAAILTLKDFQMEHKRDVVCVGTGVNLYSNNNNVDSLFDNLTFINFQQAIEVTGKNLECVNCIFGNCTQGILQNPSATPSSSELDKTEVRDLVVTNCRFQGVGKNDNFPESTWANNYCIILSNGDATRNKISNNYFDECSGIIKGSLRGLFFTNNFIVRIWGAVTVIKGETLAGQVASLDLPFYIANNYFAGCNGAGYQTAETFIDADWEGVITDNTFKYFSKQAIKVNTDSIIKSNVFSNIPLSTFLIAAENGGAIIADNIVKDKNTKSYLFSNRSANPCIIRNNLMNGRVSENGDTNDDYTIIQEITEGYANIYCACSSISLKMSDDVDVDVTIKNNGKVSGITYYDNNSYYYVVGVIERRANIKYLRVNTIGKCVNGVYTTGLTASAYTLHY